MTAVKQVKRAVVKAIADAGGMAVESYSAEKFKMSERAVTAVGARETVIEPRGGLEYLGQRRRRRRCARYMGEEWLSHCRWTFMRRESWARMAARRRRRP